MRTRRHRDDGFVLVELMMVMLILGVLAAIAIPSLAGQKQKARAASMQATLRDAATFQEARVATGGSYTASMDELRAEGFRDTRDVTVTIVDDAMAGAGGGFCLRATSPGVTTLYYASTGSDPRMSTTPCVAS